MALPWADGCQLDEGEVVRRELVAGDDATTLLDLVEEPLDANCKRGRDDG
jgi:hypothetical protein